MEMMHDIFVPGRLCILGEHTDWAAGHRIKNKHVGVGMAVVCSTNEGLYAACDAIKEQQNFMFSSSNSEQDSLDIPLEISALDRIVSKTSFYCYVAGTAKAVLSRYHSVIQEQKIGINIRNYRTTLPMKKGLSSSAAVCVLVVRSFSAVYNLQLSMEEIMELAYEGETSTGSKCGRMDQCVAMGEGAIGCMLFDSRSVKVQVLHNRLPLYFVVADLKAGKDTKAILAKLNGCFPYPKDPKEA